MDINEILTRGVAEIFPSKEGLAKLMGEKKITLYQGFDPSMPSLHLGNLVGLMKLRQFQKLGHRVIFLIGDFTGMIGDPSGKSTARKPLTRKQVLENSKLYKNQASKLLNFEGKNPAMCKYNSEWLAKLSATELINLTSNLTYQQIIERDMFQKRTMEGNNIYLNEFLYPFMQGYDSVAMNIDLEIGGSDQIFNMLMGRKLMRNILKKEKYVLATKLLVDKEGNKVGKTTGNALFLDSTANDFFAGVMSFPDETIFSGFELLTEVPLAGLEEKIKQNPLQQKKNLAFEIVQILWGKDKANQAKNNFESTFQKREVPHDIKTVFVNESSLNLLDLVFASREIPSRSEAKRLITQNAIEIDSKIYNLSNEDIKISKNGIVMRIGKKIFVKIKKK